MMAVDEPRGGILATASIANLPRPSIRRPMIEAHEVADAVHTFVGPQLRATTRLDHRHDIITAAFGWQGYHMHVFTSGPEEFGLPDPELGHTETAA